MPEYNKYYQQSLDSINTNVSNRQVVSIMDALSGGNIKIQHYPELINFACKKHRQ